MITYNKLWLLLAKKGMKKSDLQKILSSATVAKLSKNSNINTDTIGKICDVLNCQPSDIMENVTEEKLNEASNKLTEQMNVFFNMFEMATGKTKEEMIKEAKNGMPEFLEGLENSNFDFGKMLEAYKNQKIDKD